MPDTELALTAVAVLLLLAVAASRVTSRSGVPILLVFIGIGMLAGSEGIGGIEFDDPELAQAVGITALAFILFSGGLDTDLRRVRSVVGPALSLATVGVAVTCGIVGVAAHLVLDVPIETGLLVGAIVSSTDAAAVFSVLRAQNIGLRGRLGPILELESGSNDPMAVFLTIGLLTLITEPATSPLALVGLFVQQMALGAVLGFGLAKLAVVVINKARLDHDGLYPVLSVGIVLIVFGGTASLGGSGFLAAYLAGIVIGDARLVHRHSLRQFHDAIAWLAQIAMFLVLGLLAFPSDIADVAPEGVLIAAVLVLVARPAATLVALPTRRVDARDRALLAWVGLRGAVPIILATFALAEGVDDAELVFNVVFFTVLISVLVQGTTVAQAARALGVAGPAPDRAVSPLAYNPTDDRSDTATEELVVDPTSAAAGLRLVDLGLPAGSLVLLVSRAGVHLVPAGSTVFEPGDRVLLLGAAASLREARPLFAGDPDGRAGAAT